MISQHTPLPNLIVIASFFVAGSTLFASYFLLQAIFTIDERRTLAWHRDQARWMRLRQCSGLFRSLQQWIVGISQVIETNLPWFVAMPPQPGRYRRVAMTVTRWLIGDSSKLNQAARVGNAIEPWATSEIVAVGFLFSSFAVAAYGLTVSASVLSAMGLVKLVAVFLVTYRLWCYRIVSRSGQRQNQVRQFLPHAMDTIAMVMSSGGTFRSGIDTVIRDFPDQPLSVELNRLRNDMERGKTFSDALLVTKESICLPEFDELVRTLGTIAHHGAPASGSFVDQARQLRKSQSQHLENLIGRAEAMIALPTMMVMLSCMLVASAPFVLSLMSSTILE